jgi:formamidopyrimidine-DNA glycosylase
MPELPEVETIKNDLRKLIVGKTIKNIIITKSKLIKNIPVDTFTKKVKGDQFCGVFRRAKFLIFPLKSKNSLLMHLKISGSLRYAKADENLRFANVEFILNDGHKLSFCDPRLFGQIEFFSSDKLESLPKIKKLGPEPLEKKFTLEKFSSLLGRQIKIKQLLMDQNIIAGIGNLYAVEALFKSGINPSRPAKSLKFNEIKKLYSAIKDILKKAVRKRGSSLDDYVDPSGTKGGYLPFIKVYGRAGKPCFKCKKLIKRIELGGRGTYFCENCQK